MLSASQKPMVDSEIELLSKGKKIFSGAINDLPKFHLSKKNADKAKLIDKDANVVAFMNIDELNLLFNEIK